LAQKSLTLTSPPRHRWTTRQRSLPSPISWASPAPLAPVWDRCWFNACLSGHPSPPHSTWRHAPPVQPGRARALQEIYALPFSLHASRSCAHTLVSSCCGARKTPPHLPFGTSAPISLLPAGWYTPGCWRTLPSFSAFACVSRRDTAERRAAEHAFNWFALVAVCDTAFVIEP